MHPYLTPTVREMKQTYMATFKPYKKEMKDPILDDLKDKLKGVTVLCSAIEGVGDDCLGDHNPVQPCDDSVSSGQKDVPSTSSGGNLRGRVDILEQSLMEVVAYVRDEKLRRIEKNKKKQQQLGKLIYILLMLINLFI